MEKSSLQESIIKMLHEKVTVKQEVYKKTFNLFENLKSALKKTELELKEATKTENILIECRDKGDHKIEFRIGEDALIFFMHTNVFTFSGGHPILKTSYIEEDINRAYCGLICIYNFLTDSFKYNRINDVGYLIANLYINKDLHFFIEGKRQLGTLFNDFINSQINPEKIKSIIEAAILYCLEIDLFAPRYDDRPVSLSEVLEITMNAGFSTGKRLGFRSESDADTIKIQEGTL